MASGILPQRWRAIDPGGSAQYFGFGIFGAGLSGDFRFTRQET